jgi:hypothetical protein
MSLFISLSYSPSLLGLCAIFLAHTVFLRIFSICLLKSSFFLESEFQENEFLESELFSDVW